MKKVNIILIIMTLLIVLFLYGSFHYRNYTYDQSMKEYQKTQNIKLEIGNLENIKKDYAAENKLNSTFSVDETVKSYDYLSELFDIEDVEDFENIFIHDDLDKRSASDSIVNLLLKKDERAFNKAIFSSLFYNNSDDSFRQIWKFVLSPASNTSNVLKSQIITKYIKRLRSPKKLLAIYKEYNEEFYTTINKGFYNSVFKEEVKKLLKTYEKAKALPANEGYYKIINQKQTQTNEEWYETFWYRRYKENNSKEVYQILKQVDAHYK